MHDTTALSHSFSNAGNIFGMLYVRVCVWNQRLDSAVDEKVKTRLQISLKNNKKSDGKLSTVPRVQFGTIWTTWLPPCYATKQSHQDLTAENQPQHLVVGSNQPRRLQYQPGKLWLLITLITECSVLMGVDHTSVHTVYDTPVRFYDCFVHRQTNTLLSKSRPKLWKFLLQWVSSRPHWGQNSDSIQSRHWYN